MIKSKETSTAARLRTGVLAVLLGFVLVPVCAYVGGSLVVGDYEGDSGLLGYLVAIFGDALRGRWLAWVMILAPLLLVGIWTLVARTGRRMRAPADDS
jgi:hypothetical protein